MTRVSLRPGGCRRAGQPRWRGRPTAGSSCCSSPTTPSSCPVTRTPRRTSSSTRPASRTPGRCGSAGSAGPQQLRDLEREVERLAAVEAGVAHRLVAVAEAARRGSPRPAEALGHVVAGELDVHAAGPWCPPGGGRRRSRRSRARMSSSRRVFWPPAALKVLPCIGSHAHTTGWPASRTARSSGGRCSRIRAGAHAGDEREPARDPIGVERARTCRAPRRAWWSGRACSRPGCGCPRRNSTWAPSSWRVRSPIHTMCAEQSYQSPVRESRRVSASS